MYEKAVWNEVCIIILLLKRNQNKNLKKNSIYFFDIDKETLILNYANPYLINMKFKVNGYTLTQKNISGFKIVVTDEKVDFIAKRRIDEYSRSGFIGFCSREDVVNNNRLVKYITKKILMKLIVMIV